MKAFKLVILLLAVTLLGACGKKSGSKANLNRKGVTAQQQALTCNIESDRKADIRAFCNEVASKIDSCGLPVQQAFDSEGCSQYVGDQNGESDVVANNDSGESEPRVLPDTDNEGQQPPADDTNVSDSKYKVVSIESNSNPIYAPSQRTRVSQTIPSQTRTAPQAQTTTNQPRQIYTQTDQPYNPSAPATTTTPNGPLVVMHPAPQRQPQPAAQVPVQQRQPQPVAQTPAPTAERTIIYNRCYVVQGDRYLPGENPCYPRNEEIARETVTGEQLIEQAQQAQQVQQRQPEPVVQAPVQQQAPVTQAEPKVVYNSCPVVQGGRYLPGEDSCRQQADPTPAQRPTIVLNEQPLPTVSEDTSVEVTQAEPLPAVTVPVTNETVVPTQEYRVIELPQQTVDPSESPSDTGTIAIGNSDRRRNIPTTSTASIIDQQVSAAATATTTTAEQAPLANTSAIPVGTACYRLDVANFVAYELKNSVTLTSSRFSGKYSSWADEVCKLRDKKKSDWDSQLASRGYNSPISASDRVTCAEELLAVATACEMDVREGVSTSDNIR